MVAIQRRFPLYGIIGLIIIVAAEILLFGDVWLIPQFFTPIVWTGYILFVDALNYRLRGESLLRNRRSEFLLMLPWSVLCWGIFELYNLHLQSWVYSGLPHNVFLRFFAYVWSFATIFPAILETAELLQSLFGRLRMRPMKVSRYLLLIHISFGILCLIVPLLFTTSTARYFIPFVWLGFAFLLEPINYLLGGRSVFRYFENGELKQFFGLLASGLLCGLLWEFWNYWAEARWVYNIPFSWAGPKIFEMPLIGYLGFLPFAIECHAMQNYLLVLLKRRTGNPDSLSTSRI